MGWEKWEGKGWVMGGKREGLWRVKDGKRGRLWWLKREVYGEKREKGYGG